MKIITQIKVIPDNPQELKLLMLRFNNVCNYLSEIAFCENLFHWLPLQHRVYYDIREKFGLTSAESQIAIRKVAYAYSDKSRRDRLAEFRLNGSIPLFKHVYYDDNTVMFYGFKAKIQTRQGVKLPRHPKEGTLSYCNGEYFINQFIEVESPAAYDTNKYLGCDLGIVNILTDSDGDIYSGGKLNGLRHRHFKLRKRLQSKCTRSARRLLNKRRRKEQLFARDVNHQISKKVVEKAKTASVGIALEMLKGIRENVTVRKADRRQHNSWGFDQLRQFILSNKS
jgi:IS605 OrfB family transposase